MVDSHCHLADQSFARDLDEVVTRARSEGVTDALCILDPTADDEWVQAEQVASLWPVVRYTAGVHPHHAGKFSALLDDPNDQLLEQTLTRALGAVSPVCAIGEIGLDYHYDFAPRDIQCKVFRRQVRFARERDLPVVIHTREADADTVAILETEGQRSITGVFHCFTGDTELARQALDLGFFVSFSGIVTFRRADNVRDAARLVPADRLLVETDAPYLAPVPHRGGRNEPAYVSRVIDVLAETRHETSREVEESTTAAYHALFG